MSNQPGYELPGSTCSFNLEKFLSIKAKKTVNPGKVYPGPYMQPFHLEKFLSIKAKKKQTTRETLTRIHPCNHSEKFLSTNMFKQSTRESSTQVHPCNHVLRKISKPKHVQAINPGRHCPGPPIIMYLEKFLSANIPKQSTRVEKFLKQKSNISDQPGEDIPGSVHPTV